MALQREISKKRPFELPEQEAWLNLQRTASQLSEPFDRLFREHGLSDASYNVLRILRGVRMHPEGGRDGLPSGEICRRMVSRGPDMTRLVDRLVRDGLVDRVRDEADRRVVLVRITPGGEARLAELDRPITQLHREQLAHVSAADLATLNDLLVRIRAVPPAEIASGPS